MKLTIENITLTPVQAEKEIKKILLSEYNLDNIPYKIIRKSLDARKKSSIVYRYRLLVDVHPDFVEDLLKSDNIKKYNEKKIMQQSSILNNLDVIIIGSGPAGLFAALRLIEAGAYVKIFERGKPVEERLNDIFKLEKIGQLNTESNVLFGEGGAGTYSDGKLTTRTSKPEIHWFYKQLIASGAPESISYEAKPHLGTDALKKIIKNMRAKIISSGSKIFFNEKVTNLIINKNCIKGIISSSGNEHISSTVILATGHSARDMYELLRRNGVALEKKNFAVGIRVEHPAELINSTQYGKSKYRDILPAAEYFLTSKNKISGRGTYTFCMCPGGHIINSSSENSMLCTNGMSYSKRDFPFSNSAILVTVTKEDTGKDVLAGIKFQREIESMAFKSGGNGFVAPAQRITSFLKNRMDNSLPEVSYRRGVTSSNINNYLPSWITEEIKIALNRFDKKMRGFISSNGVLIGAETRSSSPVRITRGSDYQSVSTKGLYPIGEGAGYAGGIVSSAADGIKSADKIIELYS